MATCNFFDKEQRVIYFILFAPQTYWNDSPIVHEKKVRKRRKCYGLTSRATLAIFMSFYLFMLATLAFATLQF